MREAYLVMVTGQNNNKYYHMREVGDQVQVEYGRIGSTRSRHYYPLYEWDTLYNAKLAKGYQDNTHLMMTQAPTIMTVGLDGEPGRVMNALLQYAGAHVENQYTVGVGHVSRAQLDEAQRLINMLTRYYLHSVAWANDVLLELYTIIPRRMNKVQDYLIRDATEVPKIITHEQDTLDSLAGQVQAQQDTQEHTDLLEGITVIDAPNSIINMITRKLGSEAGRLKRAFCVQNDVHDDRYADCYLDENWDDTLIQLLWHGSRNQNWWHIIKQGLRIKPANASHTGSMFGAGIYFADQARKSLGYTSIDGSYWAGGNAPAGFMALYEAYLGKRLMLEKAERELTWDRVSGQGYDSVMGVAGRSLYNNEYIIYREAQCRIRFLVELGA